MNKIIGITIGDIQGIGIRILIDRWKKNQINNFILFVYNIILNYLANKYALIIGAKEELLHHDQRLE